MTHGRRAAATCLVVAMAVLAACRSRSRAVDIDAGREVRTCGPSGPSCAPGEYCAYEPRLCGKGKQPGTCRPTPASCRDAYAPVCGCDGRVYGTECEAHAAHVDLAVNGGCHQAIADWMPCGPRFCNAHESYCEIVLSDVFELPTDYACKPLPPACMPDGGAAANCDCFPAGTRCRSFCGYLDTGGLSGFHLTCRL